MKNSYRSQIAFCYLVLLHFIVTLISTSRAFQLNIPRISIETTNLKSTTSNTNEDFAKNVELIKSSLSTLRNKISVIKYGGNAMTSIHLKKLFCQDVATLQSLGLKLVIVHGGGPQISNMLEKLQVETTWQNGMRVSSKEVVDVAEMVLCGNVNKEITNGICIAGGRAIGLSGRDDSLLQCIKQEGDVDLGYVGKVEQVNTKLLYDLLDMGITPVVSPIGCGLNEDEKDVAFNVNADVAAGRIAGELRAERVLFLTDIAGVLDKDKKLLPKLSIDDIDNLIEDETITGGMIPKVSFATNALKLGVKGAFIADGRVEHALLNEFLMGGSDGLGSGRGGTVITT